MSSKRKRNASIWCREKSRHRLTSVLVRFRERYELIERLGADPQNPSLWLSVIEHVQLHKPFGPLRRGFLFAKAFKAVDPESTDPGHLALFLMKVRSLERDPDGKKPSEEVAREQYEHESSYLITASKENSPRPGLRADAGLYIAWAEFELSHSRPEAAAAALALGEGRVAHAAHRRALADAQARLFPVSEPASASAPAQSPKPVSPGGDSDDETDSPPTPIMSSVEVSRPAGLGEATVTLFPRREKTVEMPDYVKNFDAKALIQAKKRAAAKPLAPPQPAPAAVAPATAPASVEPPPPQVAKPGSLLGGLGRKKLGGLRSALPMRVAAAEAERELSPVKADSEHEMLASVPESSFDLDSSREASRRDSSSSVHSARGSMGSDVGRARASTSSDRSRPSDSSFAGDETAVIFNDKERGAAAADGDETIAVGPSVGASERRAAVDATVMGSAGGRSGGSGGDDTAVLFKGARGGAMVPDDTLVIMKGARGGEQLDQSLGSSSGNSRSVTHEAGSRKPKGRPRAVGRGGDDSDSDGSASEDDATAPRMGGQRNVETRRPGAPVSPKARDKAHDAAAKAFAGSAFVGMFGADNAVSVGGRSYFKVGVLGKGGSSKVFRVLGEGGDIFALKRVKVNSDDPKCLASFQNEIALMESLRGHSCIVQLVSWSIERRTIHMVMEAGETDLHGLLVRHQRSGSLSANFVRLAWQQMLTAVEVIHGERIVHGDLKPANFLFVQGHLKLIDFGIAKQFSNETTNIYRDNQVGTVNYMSPEAIQDSGSMGGGGGGGDKPCHKLGRASDIWSLGCILYQMVYGATPFSHIANLMTKLMAIINPAHEIAYQQLKDRTVVDAIKLCLQRDPNKRAPISGPQGLLKHAFLEPRIAPEGPAPLPLSTVRAIAKAAAEECGGADASDLEALTARVVARLSSQHRASPPHASPPHAEQHRAAPAPAPATALAPPTAGAAATDSPRSRRLREAAAAPMRSLEGELNEQRGKLRKPSESVAAKFQKAASVGGGGLFGEMAGSDLLRQNLMARRRDISGHDDTVNATVNWGVDVTESWQG